MLRRWFFLALALAAAGCSSSDLGGGDAMSDGNGIGTVDGEGPPGPDAMPPPPTPSYLRVAQLAPEIGAVDLCYRPKGTQGFTGPILAAAAPFSDAGPSDAAADAGALGVSFGTVSSWVSLPVTGALDVALVPAGDANCSAPRVLGTVTVDAGKRVTLAAMGTAKVADAGARALGLESFVDDVLPHAQTTRVRVIHGALGTASVPGWGSLSVSVAYGNQVDLLAANVSPRRASTPSMSPSVDALGYAERAPIAVAGALRFAYGPDAGAGGPWSTKPAVDLGFAQGTVLTVFLFSLDWDLGVLVCNDLPSSGAPSCQSLRAK